MSTLSADLNTPSVSASSLPKVSESRFKKIANSIGNYLIAVSETIYEARKEEVRLRAHYYI